MAQPLRGVYAPVITPFDRALAPDTERFTAHCRWLVSHGAGLAIFGTNSEAASLSVGERLHLTDHLLASGVPANRLMPGTGACALSDAVTLTQHAVAQGAPGVLVLPPFFYKGVPEEGVFTYYSEIIERVGSDKLGIYLYHIPHMTQVPITMSLIERLLKRYPHTIMGAKDSSGDWANSRAMIEAFAPSGFAVFPASESLLTASLALGGAGCISATVNVNPAGIMALFDRWNTPEGTILQDQADQIRKIFQATPMIAAMKRTAAEHSGHADWARVRPPLCALDEEAAASLRSALGGVGFGMEGYPR